ncbi:zinc-dependent alcohol dehydrogenase [Oscillospiraceae bacterium LTW-04]|nr:alcohol dehydrogenase catalytic domain-containing protein [Oscillospiraceae bacterium MB24-C1]
MRAAFIEKPGLVYFTDRPEPQLEKSDDIKIRVCYTGICGSEVHAFGGVHPFRIPPLVSGHEFSGVVSEVGSAVKDFKVGDRVTADPQVGCGKCAYCQSGQYNLCPDKRVLGATYWSGSFGEYIVTPEHTVLHLPESVDFPSGALIEPIAVGMHAVRENGISSEKSACFIGFGPIGMGAFLSAQYLGCQDMFVTDIKEYNLELARAMGCKSALNPAKTDAVKAILEATDGYGVDVVFLGFASLSAFETAFQVAKRGGTIVQVALPTGPLSLDVGPIQAKELHIRGSNMYVRKDYELVIDAISKGMDLSHFITDTFPIEEVDKAFDIIEKQDHPIVKTMLHF